MKLVKDDLRRGCCLTLGVCSCIISTASILVSILLISGAVKVTDGLSRAIDIIEAIVTFSTGSLVLWGLFRKNADVLFYGYNLTKALALVTGGTCITTIIAIIRMKDDQVDEDGSMNVRTAKIFLIAILVLIECIAIYFLSIIKSLQQVIAAGGDGFEGLNYRDLKGGSPSHNQRSLTSGDSV